MTEPEFSLLKSRLQLLFVPAMATRVDGPEVDTDIDPPLLSGASSEPPTPFRHLHSAQFLESIWRRIDAQLWNPAKAVNLRFGARAVHVLGAAVFIVDRSGQLHPFLWDTSGHLIRTDPATVMVTEIPYGTVWLNLLVRHALSQRCGKSAMVGKAGLYASQAYQDWLIKVMLRRVRASHDMRVVRHKIATAIGIDADAWRLCHRLHVDSPSGNKSCVKQYNRCVRHKTELLEVETVAPRAIGIYAEVCENPHFPVDGSPLQRLKRYLQAEGTSSRTWRLVLRDGSRVLRLVRQFYHGRVGEAIVDFLLVMQYLDLEKLPPQWLVQAIFAEWGNAGSRRTNYSFPILQSQANLRHLVVKALAQFERPDELQEEQLVQIVHWLTESTTRPFTRTQRQGGWVYMARRAREFQQQRWDLEVARGREWPTPLNVLVIGGLHLTSLKNSVQLLEEGRRMRNCIGGWTNRCASLVEFLVSVHDTQGRRIATAHFEWTGVWNFRDAKGPMNRPLPPSQMRKLRAVSALIPAPRLPNDPPTLHDIGDLIEVEDATVKDLDWD